MSEIVDFDAFAFFSHLTEANALARRYGFRCCMASDLEGFIEALQNMQEYTPLVCVSDTSSGEIYMANSPNTRRIKTIFLFMPHAIQDDWAKVRMECFAVMRELFRQFLSVLLMERARLRLSGVYVDSDVNFEEIDRYFFSGGACAFFQIAVDQPTDLQFNSQEWLTDPTPMKLSRLDVSSPKASTQPK